MIRDVALFVVMVFFVGFGILVVYIGFDEIAGSLQNQSFIPNATADRIQNQADEFPGTWDYTFLTIFIAVVIGVLALSYALRSNPIFFFVFLIVVIVLGGLAGYISNAFEEMTQDSVLGAAAANFPIMSFVFNNYLLFVVAMVMLMIIVFFAKPNEGYM